MSEIDPSATSPKDPDNWNDHYNTPEGMRNIAARQAAYWCLAPGETPPDYELEIVGALQYTGLPDEATIVDIGCSFPRFLQLCMITGLGGKKIGIDPNAKQFQGLPYLELTEPSPELEALLKEGDETETAGFFKLMGRPGSGEYAGITLYKADSNFIPLPDGTADVATSIFSGYHAFENKAALNEVKRVLKPASSGKHWSKHRAGIHADATSGNENKEEMIEDESRIANVLSSIVGQKILPPPPLQSGFTSEDTLEVFPTIYKNVYVKWIQQEIIMNFGRELILNAHRSYRDSYTSESGHLSEKFRDQSYRDRLVVKQEVFNNALELVVGSQIDAANQRREKLTAKVRRTITFASDEEIDLPMGEYTQIAP